ncbi:unnamed protein product [Allacma fusca]|uniref:Neurotransmitter-gated ion-channel ligand-binding domain-containing protein n=1 Tax=Allacma fusca TaxID=39272 RepID=A0A8J2P235_9HEXA|nr:unnamed protein product [Allacma fusca]
MKQLIFLFYFLHLLYDSSCTNDSAKIIDDMFENYDKRVRPYAGVKPLEISMSAFILDVYGIDEIRHEFTVSMYLRHLWRDPRLASAFRKSKLSAVLLDSEHAHKLWLPDTFIVNLRKMESPDNFNEATKVSFDGSIVRSNRISTTAACKFDLGYFPFDMQVCSLEFESYGFSASEFYYKWKQDSLNFVQVSGEATNPRFHVANVISKESMITMHGANFSRFSMEFTLVRYCGRYLTDIYFPIAALTVISFMTFSVMQYALKLQLSCFILAAMAVFTSISMGNLPQLSHHTSLDLFLFFNLGVVFFVVVTHFVLENFKRPGEKNRESLELSDLRRGLQASRDTLADDHFRQGRPSWASTIEHVTYQSFGKSKVIIPILYISFNIAYWTAIIIGSIRVQPSSVAQEDLNV